MEEVRIIVTVVLLVLASACNAVMDILQHKFKSSIFSDEERFKELFWNPKISWKNKWKWVNGKLKEKFMFSSTILVFTTDGWHFFQFLFHSCWQLAIAINMPHPVIMFITIKVLFSAIFELFYSKVFKV